MKLKMKAILALVMAIVIVLSLTACGSKDSEINMTGGDDHIDIDNLALRPDGEAGLLYENGGLKLLVPLEYDELLLKDLPENDPSGILFTVTEKASVDAAKATGQNDDGAGWLFSIGRIDQEKLQDLLCDDMSGQDVFAGDADGNYYILYHPTDVRYVREDNDAMNRDMELWTSLTAWAYGKVPESFLAENPSLNRETRDNSSLGMQLARIAYRPGTSYTISTTELGPIATDAESFDALPYVEQLIKGVHYEYTDGEEAPDGEYVVLSFPAEDLRFDFFLAEGGENYVREVHSDQNEFLYMAVFEDESILASAVMQEWLDALVADRGMSDLGYSADSFLGSWADKYDGRCSIVISKAEKGSGYAVSIHWGSSAFETAVWNMTAYPSGSNILQYENCRHVILNYDEGGNETETLQYENGSGSFELLSTNELLWHDLYDHAADDMPFITVS